MRAPAAALLAAALWIAASAPATGGTPSAEKLAVAVAEHNRQAGRARPLLLDVALREGEGPASATGTLAVHPTGLARLELRGEQGLERHLLQGSQYAASLDGEPMAAPRPLLPPLFLLQADAGTSLRTALASFGVAASEVGLGLAFDRDCYVIGGRPPPVPGRPLATVPSLWVDVGTFEVVAVDRADGVRYHFGPAGNFDGVHLPSWIGIGSPGQPTVRLEIQRAATANAPAAAFGTSWLSDPP